MKKGLFWKLTKKTDVKIQSKHIHMHTHTHTNKKTNKKTSGIKNYCASYLIDQRDKVPGVGRPVAAIPSFQAMVDRPWDDARGILHLSYKGRRSNRASCVSNK